MFSFFSFFGGVEGFKVSIEQFDLYHRPLGQRDVSSSIFSILSVLFVVIGHVGSDGTIGR